MNLKDFNRHLFRVLTVLALLFVPAAVALAGYATCCEQDLAQLGTQLGIAASANLIVASLLNRQKFRGSRIAGLLTTVAMTALGSLVWTVVWAVARLLGVPATFSQVLAYGLSALGLAMTASGKTDEIFRDEVPAPTQTRRGRRKGSRKE